MCPITSVSLGEYNHAKSNAESSSLYLRHTSTSLNSAKFLAAADDYLDACLVESHSKDEQYTLIVLASRRWKTNDARFGKLK